MHILKFFKIVIDNIYFMFSYFPKIFGSRAISMYITAMVVIFMLFFNFSMKWQFYVFGLLGVIGFFKYASKYIYSWNSISSQLFTRKVFFLAFSIRIIWVIFSYWYYTRVYGDPFDPALPDAISYNATAAAVADGFWGNYLAEAWRDYVALWYDPSDMGYQFYLSFVYTIGFKSILFARIIKALLGAYMCILIYKIGTRNFGETVGRVAAILCMLMPNLIYYTGVQLKELEMVFLVVLFIERADYLIRGRHFTVFTVLPPLLIAGSLFFFRTVLGATALFALFTSILFTSKRVMSVNKRIISMVWVIGAVAYFMGGQISNEVEVLWANKDENQVKMNEWRAREDGGNTYAKYATGAVFAPMIFVIPFPTMVSPEKGLQENQQLLHSGYYVKNILGFFIIFSLFTLIKHRKIKFHLLLITFICGYLGVIALSAFAQSERFHLPVLPFLLILAAFGIINTSNKHKKIFNYYLILMCIIIIGWNWLKLSGRGIV